MVDNGFIAAKAFAVSENLGRLLENQVFIELIRRGYDTDKTMFYYRSRNDKEELTRGLTLCEHITVICSRTASRANQ